jgi:hypothetical protein
MSFPLLFIEIVTNIPTAKTALGDTLGRKCSGERDAQGALFAGVGLFGLRVGIAKLPSRRHG